MAKASAKQKCWKAFAAYIRLRDAPHGYGQCISCNKPVSYPNSTGNWHAGHFYPRSATYNSLYFDEHNVNGQCVHCNHYLEGNTEQYRKGLVLKYGEGIFDYFDKVRAGGLNKMYDFQYEMLAKRYRNFLKEMRK